MKSVLSAAWLLTVAFGNLIVVVISEMKFFNTQVLGRFVWSIFQPSAVLIRHFIPGLRIPSVCWSYVRRYFIFNHTRR